MQSAIAVSPASISFIFQVCKKRNGGILGSIGIGATVDKYVKVTAKPASSTQIYFNEKPISFHPVETVIQKLTQKSVEISIHSELPLACGFGISGASSIATAYAVNKLLNLHIDQETLSLLAHEAEIENRTGLGSVATQITGGFLVKNEPGIPVLATRLPFIGKKIYTYILNPLETPKILQDGKKISRINSAATHALKTFSSLKNPSLANVLEISFDYSLDSGILNNDRLTSIIEAIQREKGHATMAMIGYTIFSNIPFPSILGKSFPLTIMETRAHLL